MAQWRRASADFLRLADFQQRRGRFCALVRLQGMLSPEDRALIDRYLAGECGPEEAAQAQRLLEQHPDDGEAMTLAVQLLEEDLSLSSRSAQHSLQALHARRAAIPPFMRNVPHRDWWARPQTWLVAVAMLGVGGLVWGSGGIIGRLHPAQAFREFASAPGAVTTIAFRDGTRLVLGPASHLEVPSDFGARTRTVRLDGRALFTVVHDVSHPFLVETAHAVVRDVGTTFTIEAYRDDPDATVAVIEGEVALGATALHARDIAVLDSMGHATVSHDIATAPQLAWTQGGLVFQDTPLRTVVRELDREFDVHITIADTALAHVRMTATFAGQSVDEVLDIVTLTVGARYLRTGRTIVIKKKTTSASHDASDSPAPLTTASTQVSSS